MNSIVFIRKAMHWRRILKSTFLLTVCLAFLSSCHSKTGTTENFVIHKGVNLSHWLSQDFGWEPKYTYIKESDIKFLDSLGFDHVRIPASWNFHTGPGPDFVISNAFLERVHAVVTGLLARGINVLLNVHHFTDFYANPAAWTNKLYAIWDQLAVYYSNAPPGLAFEILNEPHDQATTEFMNDVYAFLIPHIRQSNPERTIFVSPGFWASAGELSKLRLPASDSNLIVTIHTYDPDLYTGQGAPWLGNRVKTTNVVFPGPPPVPLAPHPDAATDPAVVSWFEQYNSLPEQLNPCSRNAFIGDLDYARDWSVYYGRPIHVGEFGAYSASDLPSRANYYRQMREEMDRRGLGWAAWDWKAGYYFWDRNAGAPATGLQ